jgi:hypothetical protein
MHTIGTLPPRLYQINPFSRQQTDEDLSTNVHELADNEMPATTEEMRQVEDEEADNEALSQAIETITREGRTCKATQKAIEGAEQCKSLNRAQKGLRDGRGGRRGGAKV